jgi:hypothetical protein
VIPRGSHNEDGDDKRRVSFADVDVGDATSGLVLRTQLDAPPTAELRLELDRVFRRRLIIWLP